jgi:hypothetical protein
MLAQNPLAGRGWGRVEIPAGFPLTLPSPPRGEGLWHKSYRLEQALAENLTSLNRFARRPSRRAWAPSMAKRFSSSCCRVPGGKPVCFSETLAEISGYASYGGHANRHLPMAVSHSGHTPLTLPVRS